MTNIVKEEIKTLAELEISILTDGKIMPYGEDEPFTCEADRGRTERLEKLMDKYSYGWHIGVETTEQQIDSIGKFTTFIIKENEKLIKSALSKLTEKECAALGF